MAAVSRGKQKNTETPKRRARQWTAAEKLRVVIEAGTLDDYADALQEPGHEPYITHDRLEDVGQRILAEKSKLRDIIDRHGGVSAVAQKSGIPQPSLSRMFDRATELRAQHGFKTPDAIHLASAIEAGADAF